MNQVNEDTLGQKKKEPILIRPTVLVGLGGTGGDVLLRVRRRFYERYGSLDEFPIVSYLWLDTDAQAKKGILAAEVAKFADFQESEKLACTVADVTAITNNFYLHSGIEEWWYPSLTQLGKVNEGAGQIRAYSRLAFFANYQAIRDKILLAYSKVADATVHSKMLQSEAMKQLGKDGQLQFDLSGHVDVVLVSSIAGGTGSGMLLDIGFLIKECLAEVTVASHLVFPGHFGKITGHERMAANAYALIKELDHYQHGCKKFVAHWNNEKHELDLPVFDYTYVYDNTNSSRLVSTNVINIFETLADFIFKDFTHGAFASNKRSTRVNLAQFINEPYLQDLGRFKQTFSKRYLSAGFSSIVFPHDRLISACAHRLAAEVVESWGGDRDATVFGEEVGRICARGRAEYKMAEDADLRGGSHDMLYALLDPSAKAEPVLGQSGLLTEILAIGKELLDLISSGRTSGKTGHSSLVVDRVHRVSKEFLEEGEDKTLWGRYPGRIRDNGDRLIEKLCGANNQSGKIKEWALTVVQKNGVSLALMRAVLKRLAEEFNTLKRDYEGLLSATLNQIEKAKNDYSICLKELQKAETSLIFLGDRPATIREYADRSVAASFAMEGNGFGFYFYQVRSLAIRELVRVLQAVVDYVVGPAVATNSKMGLISEFSFLDDSVVGLAKELHLKESYFSQEITFDQSLLMYESGKFSEIYKQYVNPGVIEKVSQQVFMETGKTVMDLRQAIRDGSLATWEETLVRKARVFFADLPRDYHVLQVLFTKYGKNDEWKEHIANRLRLSGCWATRVNDGRAFRPASGQVIKLVALPGVPTGASEELRQTLSGYREKVETFIRNNSSQSVQILDIPETSEIIFYEELGGFPINYLEGLRPLRVEYMKLYAQGRELHITKNDHEFRDPAILNADEVSDLIDARSAYTFGVAMGVLEWAGDEVGYRYTDQTQAPPQPVPLGVGNRVISCFTSNKPLCQKVRQEVDTCIDGISKRHNFVELTRWLAFLNLLRSDCFGEYWGIVKDQFDLPFDRMLESQMIEKEQQKVMQLARGYNLDERGMIAEANRLHKEVFEHEKDTYGQLGIYNNPFAKRQDDNKRIWSRQVAAGANLAPSGQCRNCHNNLPAAAKICPFCGTPVELNPQPGNCSRCGQPLLPGAAFCLSCGAAVEKSVGPVVTNCSRCRALLQPGARFCPECGAPVSCTVVQTVERRCSSCGTVLLPGGKFCNNCGQVVDGSQPSPYAQQYGVGMQPAPYAQQSNVGMQPDPYAQQSNVGMQPDPYAQQSNIGMQPDPYTQQSNVGMQPDPYAQQNTVGMQPTVAAWPDQEPIDNPSSNTGVELGGMTVMTEQVDSGASTSTDYDFSNWDKGHSAGSGDDNSDPEQVLW